MNFLHYILQIPKPEDSLQCLDLNQLDFNFKEILRDYFLYMIYKIIR